MSLLSEISCKIGDKHVDLGADWLATSRVNGGDDVFSSTIRADQARKAYAEKGAPIRLFLPSGEVIHETKMPADPRVRDGDALVRGAGLKSILEESGGRRLFQSADTGLWATDGSSPFNGTPASSMSASIEGGAIRLEAREGQTVTQNDEIALVLWVPGVKLRRGRATVVVNGTDTGYEARIYTAEGPDGARTFINLFSAPLLDETFSAPKDMIVVSLRRTGATHTRTDTLSVLLRNIRVNDLTLADGFTASQVVSLIGSMAGLDVTGVPTGPPQDTIGGSIGYSFFAGKGTSTADYTANIPAVAGSPTNVMPLDWQGSDAALFDYLTELEPGRYWGVFGNATGSGPMLKYQRFGPAWDAFLSEGVREQLAPLPVYNQVRLAYKNQSGKDSNLVVRAGVDAPEIPDPLWRYGETHTYPITLEGVQKSEAFPRAIALGALAEVSVRRWGGRLPLVTAAHRGDGRNEVYLLHAGMELRLADWDVLQAQKLQISEVELSRQGAALGVGGWTATHASEIAKEQVRSKLRPLGHIHMLKRGGAVRTYE